MLPLFDVYLLKSRVIPTYLSRHYNQPRPHTVPPFRGGPGGAMSSASAYFDLGNQHGPPSGGQQGRDWNRTGGHNYPPPERYGSGNGNYRGGGVGNRGGGGYGGYDNRGGGGENHQSARRYADIGSNGPPAAGNYRGGGQGNYGPPAQSGYRYQGPQQHQPRNPPPRVSST